MSRMSVICNYVIDAMQCNNVSILPGYVCSFCLVAFEYYHILVIKIYLLHLLPNEVSFTTKMCIIAHVEEEH